MVGVGRLCTLPFFCFLASSLPLRQSTTTQFLQSLWQMIPQSRHLTPCFTSPHSCREGSHDSHMIGSLWSHDSHMIGRLWSQELHNGHITLYTNHRILSHPYNVQQYLQYVPFQMYTLKQVLKHKEQLTNHNRGMYMMSHDITPDTYDVISMIKLTTI